MKGFLRGVRGVEMCIRDSLKAPQAVITKAPSAGLFEGQTDEEDMGVTYAAIDKYITTGEANEHDKAIIDRYHARSAHKRRDPLRYHGE